MNLITDENFPFFRTEEDALRECQRLNGDRSNVDFVVADGPEDNFAVLDISTAVDMGIVYWWEAGGPYYEDGMPIPKDRVQQ